ncbi:flagellar biosynthetic protein FliR [Rhodovibrionaceae bacterium A322]
MIEELIPAQLFGFLLVFARVGSAVMLMPTVGETYVNARARLAFALLVSLLTLPLVEPFLPSEPPAALSLAVLLFGEIIIGLFFGTVVRLFMSALTTAGMIMANMASLANALVQDPTSQQQGSIMGNFLTVLALMMIFALDLHHTMLVAIVDTYTLFTPGEALPIGDMSTVITQVVSTTFVVAMKMSAPFIVVAGMLYLGLGILGRLMPQMQVFFVAMPLQVAMGMFVMALALPVMMKIFLAAFEDSILPFLAP